MAVTVAEEIHTRLLALHAGQSLDPLADVHVVEQRLEETKRAALDVCAVVLAHDGLDGLGGFVGVVEGDGGDVVVEHVRLDNAVEELATDETEFAIDRGGSTAGIGPAGGRVVGQGRVGVLKESDGN